MGSNNGAASESFSGGKVRCRKDDAQLRAEQGLHAGEVKRERPTVGERLDEVLAADRRESRTTDVTVTVGNEVPTRKDLDRIMGALVMNMHAYRDAVGALPPGVGLAEMVRRAASLDGFCRVLPDLLAAVTAHAIEQERHMADDDSHARMLEGFIRERDDRIRSLERENLDLKHDATVAASMAGRC